MCDMERELEGLCGWVAVSLMIIRSCVSKDLSTLPSILLRMQLKDIIEIIG